MTRKHRPTLDQATTARDATRLVLKRLSDDDLNRLYRMGAYVAAGDGFPAATLGDGGPRGNNPLTSVEAATIARLSGRQRDLTGEWIRHLVEKLWQMGALAVQIDGLCELLTNLKPPLWECHDCHLVLEQSEPRCHSCQSTDIRRKGESERICIACLRTIANTPEDRPRRGMCDACRKAWERAGMPDIAQFAWSRREETGDTAQAS